MEERIVTSISPKRSQSTLQLSKLSFNNLQSDLSKREREFNIENNNLETI